MHHKRSLADPKQVRGYHWSFIELAGTALEIREEPVYHETAKHGPHGKQLGFTLFATQASDPSGKHRQGSGQGGDTAAHPPHGPQLTNGK